MTNGLLTSINTKYNLYKILMQTDTTNVELFNILKEEFKVYRATPRKGIREAKRMYYRRTFHLYKNNVKKTWALINSTLNRKTKAQTITEIKFNNNTVSNPDDIAHIFNDYLINIGRSLSDKIYPINHQSHYLNNQTLSRFMFKLVDENTILSTINRLKTNPVMVSIIYLIFSLKRQNMF